MKLLIVDNDKSLLTFLSKILKEKGHDVVCATDGVNAFEILKNESFDALFIDYVMPNMDGKTLCRFVRKIPELSKSFIILMSALAAEEWEDFINIGANVCLAKGPLDEFKKNVLWILQNMETAASKCSKGEILGLEKISPRSITKELLLSKQHLQLILNTMSQGVLEINNKNQIVYANPAILSLLKFKDIEIIGCNFFDIFPKSEKQRMKEIWEQNTAKAIKIDFDNPLIIDKSIMTLEIMPIDNYLQGKSELALFTDITRLKHAEKELKNTNKFLNQILNSSFSTSILSTDLEQKIRYWNKGAENLFGYKADEAIGKSIDILYPSSEQKIQARKLREQICRDKKEISTEIREVTKEGNEKWFKANLSPIFDDNGNVIGIQGMGEDITEKKLFKKALTESEMKFRAIFECAKDAIFIKDNNLRFTLVNPAMEVLLKIPANKFIGKTEKEVFHSDTTFGKESNEKNVLKGDIIEEEIEFSRNHDVINLHIIKVPLLNNKNEILGICGIARNISDLKAMERHLLQTYKMESIGNLAGGIAHDFNNILSSMIGFTELALDETSPGSFLNDSLQEVFTAGKRAKELVKQILAFARKSDEKKSPIQPSQVTKEVLKLIRSTIPTTIEIKQDIESVSWVMGNATQIHQVLMNLSTNAAHAMEQKSGGILDVSTKDLVIDKKDSPIGMMPGDYVEIKISDTGVGMTSETIKSIFEPYFTTKGPGEGTGMGLAMAQGVVESFGGKITVVSQVGKGTTFSIYLPATKKQTSRVDYVPEQLPTGTESILYVDDESSIVKMGSQLLERLGYSVTTQTSSIETLKLFQSNPNAFDLVITDMTMPNLTGDKLAVKLMEIRPDIPIILCTGYSKQITDEMISDIGIKAYAHKPLLRADLAKTVRKLLDEAKSSSCT